MSLQTPMLGSVQLRLQRGRFWWLGNRISDVRWWMWRLTEGGS